MKRTLVLAIVAGMLSAAATNAKGNGYIYYVSQSSAGSSDGTSYANRASLSYHNSGSGVFADLAADTVVLCGNITSQVVVPDGGFDGSVITYDGNADVYDPTATDATITAYPGSPNRTCFLISNKDYITVQNLVIDGNKTNLAVDNSSGIKIFKSSHITIDNCDIQKSGNGIDIIGISEYVAIIKNYIHDEPSSGIRMMKEWETSNYPSNITIGGSSETGNIIKDCGGYSGSGDVDSDIWVSGPCSQITISYNHLYATAESFRGFSGVYANGADDMLIEYNTVHGHNSENHRSGINIKADHMMQSNRIVIRDNHVYDQTSVRQYSESYGILISMDWEQIYVYNNYVHDCQGGINFNQGWQSENNSNGLNPSKGYCWSNTIENTETSGIRLTGAGSDTTSEVYFLNNTIYRAAIMASDWWHTGIALTLSTATGIHVENNIISDSRPNAGTKYNIAGRETSDYVANSNQYHQTGAIPQVYEYGNSNCNPCAWNSVYNPFSGDSDSAGDPLFNNSSEADFTLSPGSPCIDTGAFITTITSNTANSQTSFTVADASYFYDGWNLLGETGNIIKTEHGQITTIQTINYDTHTITVSPAIDIVNDEGVALEYTGSAPDIGAYEFTGVACFSISQVGWSLLYFDSEEPEQNGYTVNSFDGDPDTFWSTAWYDIDPDPCCPHEIQIDLGGYYDICSFRYLPRQDDGPGDENGMIKDYEFYVSDNSDDWGTAVASGTWTADKAEKQVSFEGKLGRCVRLIALSEVENRAWTTMAELNVLAVQPDTDINNDGKVNIEDFAVLACWWDDESGCVEPGWCGGADFDMSGTVDMLDFTYFAENWLRQAD